MDCKNCKHNYKPRSCEPKCSRMCENYSDYEPITNVDRIRQMTDEELAELFVCWNCDDADYTTMLPIKGIVWGTREEMIQRNLEYLKQEMEG